MATIYTDVTLFASAARTVASTNSNIVVSDDFRGIFLTLDVTAASGTTPTLDVKLQEQDSLTLKWTDIPGAAFAQKTAANQDTLKLYPGVTAAANRSVSTTIPKAVRAVAAIAGTTPSFTFTLGGSLLP